MAMKLTLEAFDFSGLTENSILMVEVKEAVPSNLVRVQKTIQALCAKGKIPKGVLVLINAKDQPIKLREIPEKVMNENGWIKLKVQLQNGGQESPATAQSHKESNPRSQQQENKDAPEAS